MCLSCSNYWSDEINEEVCAKCIQEQSKEENDNEEV